MHICRLISVPIGRSNMATWNTPEQADEYFQNLERTKESHLKWQSGELWYERKREREAARQARREARRRTGPSVWIRGVQYWSIQQLSCLRGTSQVAARTWAK